MRHRSPPSVDSFRRFGSVAFPRARPATHAFVVHFGSAFELNLLTPGCEKTQINTGFSPVILQKDIQNFHGPGDSEFGSLPAYSTAAFTPGPGHLTTPQQPGLLRAAVPTSRADAFLGALWGLSPKVIVVAKQEASHNYCAALFDRLEVGAARGSVECARVERWLLGEELKNIGACDGAERHKRLDKWATRMEGASFGRVLLSYYALLQARRAAQGLGCDGFKVREEKGIFFLCSQDRALFSVSAWRGRRFD
ncbi:hypothetical protein ZWY2020_047395 [Hordeum vulgare]|nr:hypothetical protein ZWY2020_047395 [Hordeum vulgare]